LKTGSEEEQAAAQSSNDHGHRLGIDPKDEWCGAVSKIGSVGRHGWTFSASPPE
jgi:hypothetical protein